MGIAIFVKKWQIPLKNVNTIEKGDKPKNVAWVNGQMYAKFGQPGMNGMPCRCINVCGLLDHFGAKSIIVKAHCGSTGAARALKFFVGCSPICTYIPR